MNSKLLKWVAIIFIVFAIIVLVAPFIINWAYKTDNPVFITVYTSSNILEYVTSALGALGTIALGAITLYQNHVFKEENDKSQKRLEEINNHANEVSLINTIIQRENDALSRLDFFVNEMINTCSIAALSKVYSTYVECKDDTITISPMGLSLLMTVKQQVGLYMILIAGVIRVYDDEDQKLIFNVVAFCRYTEELIDYMSEKGDFSDDLVAKLRQESTVLIIAVSDYKKRQTKRINDVLYNNLTLSEVKEVFRTRKERIDDSPS